jgi:GMP synthase (glutamine-hydrolysing)
VKCLALRHVAFEDLGVFEPALRRRGYEVEFVQVGVQALSAHDWAGADLVAALGGPIGVGDLAVYPCLEDEMAVLRQRLASQRPLLGVCLGAQLIASALHARVRPAPAKELGWAPVAP